MTISPKNATARKGENKQFSVVVKGVSDSNVTWDSSNKNIATINQSGLATVSNSEGLSGQSTEITVYLTNNSKIKTKATLTVRD